MENYNRFSLVVGAHCYHTYDQELQWGSVNLIVNVVPGMSTAGLKFALKREEVNEYFNWLDTESREAYEAADEEDQAEQGKEGEQ